MVSGFDGTFEARRVLDGEVEITVEADEGEGPETIVTALSDHYGVAVRLTP